MTRPHRAELFERALRLRWLAEDERARMQEASRLRLNYAAATAMLRRALASTWGAALRAGEYEIADAIRETYRATWCQGGTPRPALADDAG